MLHCLSRFEPHATTWPSLLRSTVCFPPAETWMYENPSSKGGMVHCPTSLWPQATGRHFWEERYGSYLGKLGCKQQLYHFSWEALYEIFLHMPFCGQQTLFVFPTLGSKGSSEGVQIPIDHGDSHPQRLDGELLSVSLADNLEWWRKEKK